MVRVLILALFSFHIIIGQTDTTRNNIFKIRPPAFRIEGLYGFDGPNNFKKPKKFPFKKQDKGNLKSEQAGKKWYFFNYSGEVLLFNTNLQDDDFFKEALLSYKGIPYKKGKYEIKKEKTVIVFPSDTDTTYLLGKFRNKTFFLVYSDTLVQSDKWLVGDLIINKTAQEKEEAKHWMKIIEKSYLSRSCMYNYYKYEHLVSVKREVDKKKKEKQEAFLQSLPPGAVKSRTNGKITYVKYTDNVVLLNDSELVYTNEVWKCEDEVLQMDSVTIERNKYESNVSWRKYGIQNYLVQLSGDEWAWAQVYQCKIHWRVYKTKTIKKLLKHDELTIYKALNIINPVRSSILKSECWGG